MELSLIISKGGADVTTIEEKIRHIIPLLLRRPRLSPVDSNTVSICRCGTVFGMMVRKHHCRSCGDVLCYQCTEKRIAVPSPLVTYLHKEGWWKEAELCRVCNDCHQRIIQYETCRPLLDQFYAHPQPLERLYQLAQANETTLYAVSYYLSEMRRIQYLFPSEELNRHQMAFLRINKETLVGHSYWLIQLLKIEPIEIKEEEREHSLSTLCARNCRPRLSLGSAVDMLIFSRIYGDSIEVALKMIQEARPSELEPYVRVLASTFQPRLYDLLFEKAVESPNLANHLYWALNILSSSTKSGETATAYREALLMKLRDNGAVNFRRLVAALEKGLIAVRTIVSGFDIGDPLAPNQKMLTIEEMRTGESHSRPIFITYKSSSGEIRQVMYKREDVRKDACLVKSIWLLADVLKSLRDPFPLVSYLVLPISPQSGLVEIVEACQTLSSVATEGTVSNFLQRYNHDRTIGDVQAVYTTSLAFWTIITYLFGVGDRHFDNIMLSKSGVLFHIDYGFIFGSDPKPYSPKIRLNSYMLEGIGGDQRYPHFKELCYKIFLLLRQNIDLIYTLLLDLALADPPVAGSKVTEPFIREHLSTVFFLGAIEEEARERLEFIIDGSRDSFGAHLNEYLHGAVKTTSRLVGWATGSTT